MYLLAIALFFPVYALLIFYYRRHWQALPEYAPKNNSTVFISLLIPARNEEKNIGQLLQALKAQSYPSSFFEIIVIDDFSTDNTAAIAKKCSLPNIRVIQPAIGPNASSKKKAIEAGIDLAKGPLIVTTDADCIPSPQWLQTLADFYMHTNAAFIAAPVKFSHNTSLLQRFQCLDFLVLQGITAASVASRSHAMCNGANLGYKKDAFIEVKGFDGIDSIATGDDMLLMHKIWQKNTDKVFYLKNTEAVVTTAPALSWRDFVMQRKRWASKTFAYDDFKITAVLVFVFLFNFLFCVLLFSAFFNWVYGLYAVGFLLLKTGIEWPFVASVSRFYGEQKLMRFFPFFQPLHIFYTVSIGIISPFGKYTWKGRKTK